jgi:hypothetical protein
MAAPIALPVPGFRAEAVLDQDRMATVWLVADASGRSGVLTIGHRVLVEESTRAAFLDWAQALGRAAASPAITDELASGLTDDGRPYLAVATGPGTLADQLTRGPLSAAVGCAYGQVLAEGLASAHAAGLAHGAVRPATVLVTDNQPTLAGFGLTAPGLGEPLPVDVYTAPEHLDDALGGRPAASPPADVYDLAVTLFVALGGRLPWAEAPASAALRGQPLPAVPGLSGELLAVVQACLAVDPASRPTAAALERILAAIKPGTEGSSPATVDPAGLPGRGIRRVAATIVEEAATAFAGAVGGAAGTAAAARLLGPPPPSPPPAAPPVAGPPPAAPPPAAASPVGQTAAGVGGGGSGAGSTTSGVTVSIAVKTLAVVVAASVVAGGAYAYNRSRSHAAATRPTPSVAPSPGHAGAGTPSPAGLVVRPPRADFGTVWLGGKHLQAITITNRGASKTTLAPAAVTGAGFALQKDTCGGRALAPRGSCKVVVVLHPVQRTRYAGELTLRAATGVVKASLAGQGDIADLAGSYGLTRRSIVPPTDPRVGQLSAWDGANEGSRELARAGTQISAKAGCGRPGCGYLYRPNFAGAGTSPIDPAANGTFRSPRRDPEIIIRPDRIKNGRVASLILVIVVTDAADPSFKITVTFEGTRRA